MKRMRAISMTSLLVALAACAHEESSAVPVTAAVTAGAARHDEATLRPPESDVRREGQRRLVRLHIAASPFPEVRAHADAIEARVLALGANVVSFAHDPPSRGWLDASKVPVRGVLVRQDIAGQTAMLVGDDAAAAVVASRWPLRDALLVEARGLSRPVTLCAPGEALDPTPCVAAADVAIGSPAAYVDEDGALRFVDRLPIREAASLASGRDRLELPVIVGATRVVSFDWPVRYERPRDLLLSGSVAGAVGPHLVVKVDHRDASRYVFDIEDGETSYVAVVEASDVREFHIASRGAPGAPGSRESSDARESSDPRGAGGPGGRGGDIDVDVDCGGAPCGPALTSLRRTFVSFGGPGGDGVSGADGPRGKPGHVTVRPVTRRGSAPSRDHSADPLRTSRGARDFGSSTSS